MHPSQRDNPDSAGFRALSFHSLSAKAALNLCYQRRISLLSRAYPEEPGAARASALTAAGAGKGDKTPDLATPSVISTFFVRSHDCITGAVGVHRMCPVSPFPATPSSPPRAGPRGTADTVVDRRVGVVPSPVLCCVPPPRLLIRTVTIWSWWRLPSSLRWVVFPQEWGEGGGGHVTCWGHVRGKVLLLGNS